MPDQKANPSFSSLPRHVAVIMDGNRRWAKNRGLEPAKGHDAAANQAIEPIIRSCVDLGIPYVTFWAFSTENWKRDLSEITTLFNIFRHGLSHTAKKLVDNGVRLRVLGDISRFPADIANRTLDLINTSKSNRRINVTFALNYGGRDEIVRAVKKIVAQGISSSAVTADLISQHLDTADLPDPDLIIRTGGEQRLSGFLPWQSVYAEYYFTPVLFPDFTPTEFLNALKDYAHRDRRFGGNSSLKTDTKKQA